MMMPRPGLTDPFFMRPPFGELPVGCVTAFAGTLGAPDSSSPPATITPQDFVTNPLEAWGWMYCDGRTLVSADYPELFDVLGYVYGGSGNNFQIPDYRGYFLRGNGNGTQNDPDISTRNVPPGGQGSSNGVGSIQSFAVQTHEHTYNTAPAPASAASGDPAAAPATTTALTTGGPVQGTGQTSPVMVSPYETRPLNAYVNYIIKFTYGLYPFAR